MQKRALTRAISFKEVVDSAILHFCVACQNIILKKYQTDLTITLIRNGVNLKAAFCKSLW